MGADIQIFFKLKKGYEIDYSYPISGEVLALEKEDRPRGATHKITSYDRYYGENYHRGDFPKIFNALIKFFVDKNIEKIWYGSDEGWSEEIPLLTKERLYELFSYYLETDR